MQRSNLDWALAHYGAQKLLDAKGRDLRTPLHFAITNNDPDLIDELLDLGGWGREERGGQEGEGGGKRICVSNYYRSPPCFSSPHSSLLILYPPPDGPFPRHVIDPPSGADAFVKDSEGVTPLDMAKQAGHTRMARAIANNMKVQLVSE